MNRGSHVRVRLQVRQQHRFNEAPIHESGKFEEKGRPPDITYASMRPRFMNRGSGSMRSTT